MKLNRLFRHEATIASILTTSVFLLIAQTASAQVCTSKEALYVFQSVDDVAILNNADAHGGEKSVAKAVTALIDSGHISVFKGDNRKLLILDPPTLDRQSKYFGAMRVRDVGTGAEFWTHIAFVNLEE